MVTIEWKAQ